MADNKLTTLEQMTQLAQTLDARDDEQDKKIEQNVKHVPQTLDPEQQAQARENIGVVQADLAQNDETKPDYVKNRQVYPTTQTVILLPEQTVELTQEDALEYTTNGGATAIYYSKNVVPATNVPFVGNTLRVIWDGTEYLCEKKINQYGFRYFGNLALVCFDQENSGEPFYLGGMDSSHINVALNATGTHTISIEYDIDGYHQFPAEYIPDRTVVLDLADLGITSDDELTGDSVTVPDSWHEQLAIAAKEERSITLMGVSRQIITDYSIGSYGYISAYNSVNAKPVYRLDFTARDGNKCVYTGICATSASEVHHVTLSFVAAFGEAGELSIERVLISTAAIAVIASLTRGSANGYKVFGTNKRGGALWTSVTRDHLDSDVQASLDNADAVGDIATLQTTDQSSLVAAINELVSRLAALESANA